MPVLKYIKKRKKEIFMKLKKLLAGITAAAMAVSMASFSAFAADGEITWSGTGAARTVSYTGEAKAFKGNSRSVFIDVNELLEKDKEKKDVVSVNCEITDVKGEFTATVANVSSILTGELEDVPDSKDRVQLSNTNTTGSIDSPLFDLSNYIRLSIDESGSGNFSATFTVSFEYDPGDTTDMSKVPDEVNVDFISSPTAFKYDEVGWFDRFITVPIEIPGVILFTTTLENLKAKDVKINLNNISFGYVTVNGEKVDIGPEDLKIEIIVHCTGTTLTRTFDFADGSSINTSLTQLTRFESEEYPGSTFEDCEYVVVFDDKVLDDLNISPTDTVMFYPTSTAVSTPSVVPAPAPSHGIGMPPVIINQKDDTTTAAADTEKTEENTSVELKDSTKLSKDLIDSVSDKDSVEFKLDNGASWEIAGSDLKDAAGMDLGIVLNTNNADKSQIESVSKDSDTLQFSLNHEGNFGFKAKINIPVDNKYDGLYANLYWVNGDKPEYIGSSKVANEIASFEMTHASGYIIFFNRVSFGEDISSGAGVHAEESGTASAVPAVICVSFAALAAVSAVIIKKRAK